MGVKEYYDFVIKDLENYEMTDLAKLSYNIRLEKILKYLEFAPSNTLLDIGGGSGRYTIGLAQKGYNVTLNDISEHSLKIAKMKVKELGLAKKVVFKLGDITYLNFCADSFGGIVCEGSVFSYLNQPNIFLDKIFTWLQSNGILILTASSLYGVLLGRSSIVQGLNIENSSHSHFDFIKKHYDEREFIENKEYNVAFKGYTVDNLIKILESKGLCVMEVYGRNVWDLFFSKTELDRIMKNRIDELQQFETNLHQKESLVDVCHSIAIICKKNN